MIDTSSIPPNPYVGPRSFEPGETLYGRARELRDLVGLLVAERIVLLYSPSGAGKTSLIQAALAPALRAREFSVLPPMRVSLEPPPDLAGSASAETPALRQIPGLNLAAADADPSAEPSGPNRFVLSLLLSLEEALPEEQQLPLPELAGLTLVEYLNRRGGDADEVLIFDQFEEILTIDPGAQAARAAFFTQVGAALRERRRWALFAAREDYVASLAPYVRPIPTRLATTFRLDLLSASGAREAIVEPARAAGVRFEDAAAAQLVDDLRRTVVQLSDGSAEEVLGPAIEPVQLQVVCRRLWERLAPGTRTIGAADLAAAGDVNSALAAYYAERVAHTAQASGVRERQLRDWFDEQLITAQGIRGQVLRGPEESQGLPNVALPPLLGSYLVRAEKRRGATWYELAHDRLIEPVRQDNAAWAAANLSALQRGAELWEREGRPSGLLLRDQALADAEQWAAAHPAEMAESEQEFLDAARTVRAAAERERRQARNIRLLAIGATVVSILALLALVAALYGFNQAEEQRQFALANAQEAFRNERIATSRELAAAALSNLSVDPLRSVLLAQAALLTTSNVGIPDVPAALDALQQAVQASRARLLLAGHAMGVQGLAYSPDGTRIATASEDGSVGVWDAASGQELLVFDNVERAILDVAWTPDGKQLLTGDLTGEMRLVDAATGKSRSLLATASAVYAVDVSPDGRRIAAGYDNGDVLIMNLATGEELRWLTHDELVDDVAWSPDGQQLATASGGAVYIWNPNTGSENSVFAGHTDLVVGLAWQPEGTSIASASLDGTARVWDSQSGELLATVRGHTSSVNSVAWSPDGAYLATGSADGTVKIWYIYGDLPLVTLSGHQDWVTRIAWHPDGTRLASASLDDTARVWDTTLLPHDGVFAVDWNRADARLATGGASDAVLWNLQNGRPTRFVGSYDGPVTTVRLSPDGSRMAVTSAASLAIDSSSAPEVGQVAVVASTIADDIVALQGHTGGVNRAVWRSDGRELATASDDRTVRVWDPVDGRELRVLEDHGDWVVALGWSPDGVHIASGDRGGMVILWDAASGQELWTYQRDNLEVNSLAWSPDSTRIVLAQNNGQALVLDAATRTEVLTLDHPPDVRDVAWSPDGTRIATLGSDKTLRLWDAATGAELQSYTLPADPYELAWSHDGRRIAVATADSTPRIFELEREALLNLAAQRAVRTPTEQECRTYRLQVIAGCPSQTEQGTAP
jgi:WD40 repeat protein